MAGSLCRIRTEEKREQEIEEEENEGEEEEEEEEGDEEEEEEETSPVVVAAGMRNVFLAGRRRSRGEIVRAFSHGGHRRVDRFLKCFRWECLVGISIVDRSIKCLHHGSRLAHARNI